MNVYKGRLLKKSSNRKLKLVLSNWHSNIAFHLRLIWLQTLVAIDSELRLTLFPSFCTQTSEVAVLFYLNLSTLPFPGQVIDLYLLLCTGFDLEHTVLFLCHIFAHRRMTDRKIEQHLANSIEIFIFYIMALKKNSDLLQTWKMSLRKVSKPSIPSGTAFGEIAR